MPDVDGGSPNVGGDQQVTGSTTQGEPNAGGGAPPQSNNDPVTTNAMKLYGILQSNPELAASVADLIEQQFAPKSSPPSSAEPTTPPVGAGVGTGAGPDVSKLVEMFNGLQGRLGTIEQRYAEQALQSELADARKEYEVMKDDFPILPELNDQEILQIAYDKKGLPLKDALYLWAVNKMRSGGDGQGKVADRMVSAVMEKSKTKNLPPVEGKGGATPTGEAPPPTTFRQARRGMREFLQAMGAGVTGQ